MSIAAYGILFLWVVGAVYVAVMVIDWGADGD